MCSNCNGSLLEDWTAETRLVSEFTQSAEETDRSRHELDSFVARSLFHNALSYFKCAHLVFTGCLVLCNRQTNTGQVYITVSVVIFVNFTSAKAVM